MTPIRNALRWLVALAVVLVAAHAGAADVAAIANDARFEPAVARAAMSHPGRFRFAGLYTLDPIDPSKEVVLFVHGANGTPRDLLALAADLDGTRRQAWFAYYASGDSLEASGHRLAREVEEEMRSNGIASITVVAHSMGGLVAWRAIAELEGRVTVKQFVSINTPWGGVPSARLGAWFSPSPLPIWLDLSPGSEALQTICRGRLKTPHTLVYTVKPDARGSGGDGTVSRASQTVSEIEERASSVVREVGTHMSALQEPEATQVNRLLLE